MIDEVEIIINKDLDTTDYLINYKEQTCFYNGKMQKISEEDLNEIMNQMVLLNREYPTDNSIDREEFTILVNKEIISHGKGKYPKEYLTIKEILGGYKC